jgi:hypothetical protein
VGGEDALDFWYVVMLDGTVCWDLFRTSDVLEDIRAGLCAVVVVDIGGHYGCDQEGLVLAWVGFGAVRGERLMRYGISRRARHSVGLWVRPNWWFPG